MWYLGSKWRCCVNDESDSLKRLIISGLVNYIGDQDNVELIAELPEVSLDFLSILSTESRNRDQNLLMVETKSYVRTVPRTA